MLRALPELGVDFIDTADSYGPHVSEELIREALHPYAEGSSSRPRRGLLRTGPDRGTRSAQPEYLRQCVPHEPAPARRRADRPVAAAPHRPEGPAVTSSSRVLARPAARGARAPRRPVARSSVEEIKAAQEHFQVATVQNLYNLANRQSEAVLDYCEEQGIGFIPWFPLAAGDLAQARRRGRRGRGAARRHAGAGGARVAAAAQPGDAAHPRHRRGRSTSRRTWRPRSSSSRDEDVALLDDAA